MKEMRQVTKGSWYMRTAMESHQPLEPNETKKAYTPPKLVRLGSVRDLTFGTSIQPQPDGGFTKAGEK